VHHVTNQGAASRYALAVEALNLAGFDATVVPVTASELDPPRPATRPKQSVLDNAALRLAGIPLLADYHEPLERLVKQLIS
jgi:dTDP-4-dehydrorhamnose reductase